MLLIEHSQMILKMHYPYILYKRSTRTDMCHHSHIHLTKKEARTDLTYKLKQFNIVVNKDNINLRG